MDKNEGRKLASEPYEAMYTAEITNGYLTLPVECLKDKNSGSIIMSLSWKKGIVCLYTSESFEEVRHNLGQLNTIDPGSRMLKRRILGNAEEVNVIDGNKIHIKSDFLTELGFDPNQEKINLEQFTVVILKFSNAIEILSRSLFEEMYG